MPRTPRLLPRFLLALLASLLLHGLFGLGDSIWLWWQAVSEGDSAIVQATAQQLKSQSLATGPASRTGALPDGVFSVQLGRTKRPAYPADNTQPAARHAQPAAVPVMAENPAQSSPLDDATDLPPAEPAQAERDANPSSNQRPVLDAAFPHSVDIDYVAFGLIEAEHRWRAKGKRYEITTRIKLEGREMRSTGEINRYGLRPSRFSDGREGWPVPTAQADFNWTGKTVRLGEPGKQSELALEDGAQDLFSAAYQFALQGDKLPSFDMQVLSGRHSYQVPFALKGETELRLSEQTVTALVLAGTHKQRRFEFYLAPAWNNLPVRIRMADGEKVIDLRASQISIDGTTVLARPARRQRDR